MPCVSVLMISNGDACQLANIMHGLERQTQRPSELIVVVMQHQPLDLPDMPYPVRQMILAADPLLLGAARNAATMAASGEVIVFLSDKCMPTDDMISDYAEAAGVFSGVVMGEVRSLPKSEEKNNEFFDEFASLVRSRIPKCSQPPQKLILCEDYRRFSLQNFAIRRDILMSIGGFDEQVGEEDLMFSKKVKEYGIQMAWISGATAYYS